MHLLNNVITCPWTIPEDICLFNSLLTSLDFEGLAFKIHFFKQDPFWWKLSLKWKIYFNAKLQEKSSIIYRPMLPLWATVRVFRYGDGTSRKGSPLNPHTIISTCGCKLVHIGIGFFGVDHLYSWDERPTFVFSVSMIANSLSISCYASILYITLEINVNLNCPRDIMIADDRSVWTWPQV